MQFSSLNYPFSLLHPPPPFWSQSNHTLAFSTPTFFNLKIETLLHQEFVGYIEHIIYFNKKHNINTIKALDS